jgi:ribosomal protein S18 acetylase RimI-like enzyme
VRVVFAEIKPSEIPEIAKLHLRELQDGVLYLVGEASLNNMYVSLIKEKNYVLAAYLDKKLVGYVTLITSKPRMSKIINLSGWFNLLFKIICKPKLAYQIYETLLFDRASYKAVLAYSNGNKVLELSHFSISSDFQSNGIGKKLIEIVVKMAKSYGYEYIYTTSHNQRLSNHYVKNMMAKVINSGLIGGKLHQCLAWTCR